MRDLLYSNDPVALSYAGALLANAGIEVMPLDFFTAGMEGSIGAIPRRLAVLDEDFAEARALLQAAGLPVSPDEE
jgi:hypothetical protein